MTRFNQLGYVVVALPILLLLTACGLAGNNTQEGIAVGAAAPDFTLPDAAGDDEVSLSDYEGQPVLLYFHMAVG